MAKGVNVPITATDETGAAWKSATQAAKGFEQTMGTLNKVVGGFGALQLGRKLMDIGADAVRGAVGLGDFILEAEKAGAALDADIIESARGLREEVGSLTTVLYEAGANLAGPFVDDIRGALEGIRNFVDENMGFIKRTAQAARDAAASVIKAPGRSPLAKGFGAFGGMANLLDEQMPGKPAPVVDPDEADRDLRSAQRLGTLTDSDRKIEEQMILEAKAEKEKAARELQRARDHAERKRAQEQAEFDRDFERQTKDDLAAEERRITKEQQELVNQQTHAAAVMEQFTFSNEQRLAAIDAWEAREVQAVGNSKAAQLRIIAQAEKMRGDLEKREAATRAANRHRDVSAGLSLLSVAFGKNKGFALAEAAINMWTGATAELRSPAPGKFARVAMVIASGMKSIMNISKTNPGSDGGTASSGGGGGGGAEGLSSSSAAGFGGEGQALIPAKVQPRGTVEVHFTGNVMLPEFTREHILPEIRSAVGDNYDLKIFDERGVPRTRSG